MLRRGVSEKVFRGGQSGGEVLWRKRSKDCVAVVTDGGFCECPPWIVSSAVWVPSTAQHRRWGWSAGAQEMFVDEKVNE